MAKHIIEFKYVRSTVNTHVYRSDNSNCKTIYLGKNAFGYPPAKEIRITIEDIT